MKYLVTLIVVILVTVSIAGGYAYALSLIRISMDATATARAEGIAAEGREKFARSAENLLQGLAKERAELDSYVATDADFIAAIETVEATARREGITVVISEVDILPGRGSNFHDFVSVSVSATGAFGRVASFMSALETLPVASRLTSVSFESSENGWFGKATLEFVKRKP